MAGRRRRQRPYGGGLVAWLASMYAARMGPAANSPLGGQIVMSAALQSAKKWYNTREIINSIYKDARRSIYEYMLSKLGRPPNLEYRKIYALANAAGSVVIRALQRRLGRPVKEALDEALARANKNVRAPDSYVEAVKKAALARLGIFDTT